MKLISWLTSSYPSKISYAHAPNELRHRFFRLQEHQTKYRNELFQYEHLDTADAFVIKKMIADNQFNAVMECYSKSKSKLYVYDPDVNYFEDEYRHSITKDHIRKAKAMLDISSAQMCSSVYLYDLLKDRRPDLIPTAVPYRNCKVYGSAGKLKLGWCGIAEKAEDLMLIAKVLNEVKDVYDLVLVSNNRPIVPLDFQYVPYYEDIFQNGLMDIDVAISPRYLDNCYNRGHSELKITNWMSIGVPVICSPQPSYIQCIDGENGIIVSSSDEWKEAFMLLSDGKIRQEMGEAAYQTAHERYSGQTISGLYEEMLDDLFPKD